MSSPVRLPPARWVTQTAAFRRWFGHSKVVDADGKPLVVYHVTRHEFAEFDIKRGDLGAHFGTAEQAREIARYFGVKGQTGARTIPAYLSLRNPLRLDDMGAWSGPALALQLQKLGLLPADLPVSNWSGAEGREAVRQAIVRGGYDGVVYANTREGRGDSYIAFRAEQIKSAIGNRGTFDLDDPNVLFDRDDRPLETVDPAREFARRPRRRAAGLDEFGLRLFGLRSIDDVLPAYRNLALRPVPAFLRDVDAARALRRELATIDPIASLDDNGNISVGSIDRVEGLTRFADERGLGPLIRRRLAGASILAPNPFLEGMGFVRYGPSVTFAASGGKAQGQQNQVVWSRNLQGAMLYDLTPGSPLPRGMYSALQAAVMGLDAKSMTPGDWQVRLKAMVGKNDVKADEIEWSGVLEWLGLQQGRVAKDAVVEYLRNNGVQVEEVTLRDQQSLDDLTPEQQGDVFRLEELGWEVTADMEDARRVIFVSPDGTDYNAYELQDANDVDDEIKQRALRIADPAQQPAKFGQYQLPGGTNYREVLLTLPRKETTTGDVAQRLFGRPMASLLEDERQAVADEMRRTYDATARDFRSGHWDQPNVLAHIRLNDRTDADGKRVLFVEEIQSDWAQQGRKKGFKSGQQGLPAGWTVRRDPAMDAYASGEPAWRAVHPNGEVATGLGFGAGTASEAAEQLGSTMRANEPGVSRAPFVESTDKWVALALKRVLRMAAEGGSPGNEAWSRVTKPQRTREQFEQYFGLELAAVLPLEVVDAAMLGATENDQIRRVVVEAIPVDVVNILSDNGITPEQLVREPNVVGKLLPVVSRATVARGLADALAFVGARGRAVLRRVLSGQVARRDGELDPAIRARDFQPDVVVRLLTSPSRSKASASGGGVGLASARDGAEAREAGLDGAGEGGKLSSAQLAEALNRHDAILQGAEGNVVTKYVAPTWYERIAFITGEQSADRYDLSKQIDKLTYSDDGVLRAFKGREAVITRNTNPGELPDVIGKEAADRLMKQRSEDGYRVLSGMQLKVGGEGMRTFYDKIVPKVLGDVSKKAGESKPTVARIGVGEPRVSQFTGEPTGEYDDYTEQPAIDITPAMRERIMGGLPLFDRARPKGSIPVPRNILPYWIRTAPQLATVFGRWEAGKITDKALAGAVRAELDKRKERRERAGDRVRGADWIRKRLVRARRTGELSEREVDLALWLIDQNPAVATDLGISIREGDENSPNGTYNLLTRVVTIFSSRSNEDSATHEILHHTERMLPEDVREGVRKEWLKQLRLAVKNAQASEQQRTMMDWMLDAAEQGDDGLALRLWSLRGQDGVSVQDVLPYKLAAASEFWAVNGAALLRQKAEAGTWVQKAKQWLRELVAKVRSLLGLPSDAAVLKGLRAVIAGDGTFVSKSMISAVGSDVRDETERTIARRARSAVLQFMAGAVKPTDTIGLGDTPPLLVELGAEPLPLQIQGRTLDKVLRGKHTQQMTAEQVVDALAGVARPVAVFRDAEGMIALTRARDRRGNPVIVPIHLRERDGRLTVNRVASAYGLEDSIARLKTRAAAGQMLYAESTNPEQSTTWDALFRAEVVQAARDSGRSFRLGDGDVNPEQMADRTDNPTNSAAFRRWFGDSKVVDENGEPLVVYHYSPHANSASIAKRGLVGSDATSPGGDRAVFVSDTYKPQPGMVAYAIDARGLDLQPDDTTEAPGGERWFAAYGDIGPEQIKSAIGNRGTFDPDDPNILADRTKERDDVTADVGSDTVRQDRAALPRLKAGASRGVGADIDLWEQGGRADAADPEACESSKWRAAG